jgi:hypothetical protein
LFNLLTKERILMNQDWINKNVQADYDHYRANRDKPLSERYRRVDLKKAYSKRYPELTDEWLADKYAELNGPTTNRREQIAALLQSLSEEEEREATMS